MHFRREGCVYEDDYREEKSYVSLSDHWTSDSGC